VRYICDSRPMVLTDFALCVRVSSQSGAEGKAPASSKFVLDRALLDIKRQVQDWQESDDPQQNEELDRVCQAFGESWRALDTDQDGQVCTDYQSPDLIMRYRYSTGVDVCGYIHVCICMMAGVLDRVPSASKRFPGER